MSPSNGSSTADMPHFGQCEYNDLNNDSQNTFSPADSISWPPHYSPTTFDSGLTDVSFLPLAGSNQTASPEATLYLPNSWPNMSIESDALKMNLFDISSLENVSSPSTVPYENTSHYDEAFGGILASTNNFLQPPVVPFESPRHSSSSRAACANPNQHVTPSTSFDTSLRYFQARFHAEKLGGG
jgi:hypothetical protein